MLRLILRILRWRYLWRLLRRGSWASLLLLIASWLFGRRR